MATLHNHTDNDLFCAALHVMVPAHDSVEIDDDDAAEVNTTTGIFAVTSEQRPEALAVRASVKRGSATTEVSAAPTMETR